MIKNRTEDTRVAVKIPAMPHFKGTTNRIISDTVTNKCATERMV